MKKRSGNFIHIVFEIMQNSCQHDWGFAYPRFIHKSAIKYWDFIHITCVKII